MFSPSEQIVPVKSWGKTHIYTGTGSSQDSSIYTIHAYYKDTLVSIPGRASVLLQPGQHWQGAIIGSGVITTSQPASVVQVLETINGSFVDPSLIQVPSEEQFGRKFGLSTPPKSANDDQGFFNYLNIVVTKGESQHVLLNDRPLSHYGNWVTSHVIPGIDYEDFIVHVPKGEGVYFVEQDSVTNTSPFSVIVYGYESYETYGCAAGLSLPSDERLLSFNPFFLREVGREQLVVTLPCVESNEFINQTASCSLHARTKESEENTGVEAYFLDSYTLICSTPMFYEVGYTVVEVSRFGRNRTVTFRGNVYVASQDVLPPVIVVQQQDQLTGVLDFTTDVMILLEWPANGLPNFENVDISIQVAVHESGSDGFVVWTADIFDEGLRNVNNTGTYGFKPTDLDNGTLGIIARANTSTMIFSVHFSTSGKPLFHVLSSGFLITLGTTSCSYWSDRLILEKVDDIDPCPCTDEQASTDGNFQRDEYYDVSYFHNGASSCYRCAAANGSAGQECCYDYEGNILVTPTGGGTADAVAPGNSMNLGTFLHYFNDVLPWFSCCKLSTKCDEYYIYRPSDDCSTYVPPIPAGGTGDPHFKSLDGKDFTFNGVGEFLLLQSSLDNTIFQVRMETLPGAKASVYTAFVISSNSSLPVQIQRSPLNDTLVVVDGNPIDMYYNGFLIQRQNFQGLRIEVNSDVSEVRIRLRSGVTLVVRITTEMMSFILQLPDLFKGRVAGLLGNFNGDPDDDLNSRNGSYISSNSSLEVIHYEFGLSWILEEHNSIFTYFPPFNFLSFHMPSFTPYLEFPDPNNVSDDVVALCGDSQPCLFDAVSTGSLSFANETLQEICNLQTVIQNSEKIISCGFPGKVANGYINGSVYLVGYNLTVICEKGFLLIGSSMMTCQEDGNWSSALPICNANYFSLEPWALGVIITTSVVLVIAIFGISLCLIRRQHMKYNVKEVTNQVAEKTPDEYVYEQNVESKVEL